jgi:hypothetical protein
LFGSGSPEIYFPSPQIFELRKAVESKVHCLAALFPPERSIKRSKGVVGANLLAWVPRDQVFSQRFPEAGSSAWSDVNFVLLAPQLPTFELSSSVINDWYSRAQVLGYEEACATAGPEAGVKAWVKRMPSVSKGD